LIFIYLFQSPGTEDTTDFENHLSEDSSDVSLGQRENRRAFTGFADFENNRSSSQGDVRNTATPPTVTAGSLRGKKDKSKKSKKRSKGTSSKAPKDDQSKADPSRSSKDVPLTMLDSGIAGDDEHTPNPRDRGSSAADVLQGANQRSLARKEERRKRKEEKENKKENRRREKEEKKRAQSMATEGVAATEVVATEGVAHEGLHERALQTVSQEQAQQTVAQLQQTLSQSQTVSHERTQTECSLLARAGSSDMGAYSISDLVSNTGAASDDLNLRIGTDFTPGNVHFPNTNSNSIPAGSNFASNFACQNNDVNNDAINIVHNPTASEARSSSNSASGNANGDQETKTRQLNREMSFGGASAGTPK
jgi:hypothetical protein